MPEEKFRNNPTVKYEYLCDHNLLGLGLTSGCDWSSIIQEECQAATNQPVEEETSNFTSKTVLFAFLTTIVLLGSATWIVASEMTEVVQKVQLKSVEQAILRGD
jgi:hypothetical protein